MFKTTQDNVKMAVWAIIAVVAIALAVFSGYKSFIAPQQGKNVGFIDMFPGGKAGLMKQQPSPEIEGGAPAEAGGSVR
jgi:hypothetical protein